MGLNEDTIDIPESGAVFTLGKSHLSENHQSYFFIKNDAIRKLICGRNQSAVVCESGRVFVWGENPYGQLGIGANEIVTKPSCVKTIKALGQRVRNVAFGEAFAVILTESSQLYYSGRSVFDANATPQFRERFWNLGNDLLVSRKPFELVDFARTVHQGDGSDFIEQLVDVAAGDEHFVLLTGSGQLFGWGSNSRGQLSETTMSHDKPVLLSQDEEVRVVSCGRFCTAFISANNEIFIIGQLGQLAYVRLTQINTTSFEELMYSMYLAHDDQIYLVINSGEIFRSEDRDGDLSFAPHNVISENIRKICTGDGYVAIVTESNKLLTTFRERTSATSTSANDRIRSPREHRKFNRLDVLDAVAGQNHILVHAVQPSSNGQLILSSSSNDEDTTLHTPSTIMNDLNRTYTKTLSLNDKDNESDSLLKTLRRCLTMKDTPNILASKIPVFDSSNRKSLDRLSISSDRRNSSDADSNEKNNNTNLIEDFLQQDNEPMHNGNHPIEKSLSLNEFEKLEREQASVNDEEIKETNEIPATELPHSAGSQKSIAQTVFHITPSNTHVMRDDGSRLVSRPVKDLNTENVLNFDNKPMLDDETISLQTLENDITFIDNGVNMSKDLPNANFNESGDTADVGSAPTTKEGLLEDNLLGETIVTEVILDEIDIKEETKQAVRIAVDEISNKSSPSTSVAARKKTPMPRTRNSDELDDGERTTASITSISSVAGNRNPFDEDDDDVDKRHNADDVNNGLVGVETGRVKRFIREMRSKGKGISCRSADTVAEEQINHEVPTTTLNPFEESAANDRTSKVCTIL